MAIQSIQGAASPIAGASRDTARSTGTSFEYLLTTAQIESNLKPAAQLRPRRPRDSTSSSTRPWLATMKQAGPALGLGHYANAIVQMTDGRYAVPDANARAAILKLRSDPTVSAKMAGIFTRSNAAKLAASIGRKTSEGELYIAHFLRPDGAAQLISTAASRPRANAVALFPAAAAANRPIFYDRAGHALSARAVYDNLTSRYGPSPRARFRAARGRGAGAACAANAQRSRGRSRRRHAPLCRRPHAGGAAAACRSRA